MEDMLKEYEKILDRMFSADKWLKDKEIENWEVIKGKKAYIEYHKLLKEAEQLQRDLHKHLAINSY